ncbi:hypothetical protein crov243 [Cafeteria roenbergensis virus]|uniref:Uncharacterized protein n=1 Tax=Cafeteria roenbergensis virus (strain BV-PW1) TaxID=693272 RepID=E3T513_CROVB|nr:hypothetical protein crov243 [Cafeteria roenbergensis virus BV-PW1]ADO67276.1 hypothetical protein crov243 [Cafeteria roenbergensis virus BV-PW1]
MTQILLIDNFKIFKSWASKTYQYKIDQLKKDSRYKVIDVDELTNIDINNYKNVIFGWNLCIYSKYYTLKHNFYSKKIPGLESLSSITLKTTSLLESSNINKYLIVQDFINPDDYQEGLKSLTLYLKKYKFTGILTPYLNTDATIPLKKELPNIKLFHIPHHIDETKFKNWKLNKEYDIFIFGNCKKNRYPFRNRLLKILEELQQVYKICFWNDIMSKNYFKFNKNISNENLSKQINKSWLTICTKSYADVLLGKYMETSMSASCILGDMASDGLNIWKDNYIKLNDKMCNDEIKTIIKQALENKQQLLNNINIMESKMSQFYLSSFPDRIYNIL